MYIPIFCVVDPYISVIIPAHNEEKYIVETLDSLKKQEYPDFETIVVTNGCTDQTEDLIKEQSSLIHLSLPVANVSRARNHGASKAKGSLLLFLDADTRLEKDALRKVATSFKNGVVVGTTKALADEKKLRYFLAMKLKNFYTKTKLYKGSSGVLICQRNIFDQVNGYDADLHVKEHRKLIEKMCKHGSYTCVNTYATTSMRRFKEWGLVRVTLFWVKQWVYDKVGDIRKSEYERVR